VELNQTNHDHIFSIVGCTTDQRAGNDLLQETGMFVRIMPVSPKEGCHPDLCVKITKWKASREQGSSQFEQNKNA